MTRRDDKDLAVVRLAGNLVGIAVAVLVVFNPFPMLARRLRKRQDAAERQRPLGRRGRRRLKVYSAPGAG